jgi:oligoendopeptidase F
VFESAQLPYFQQKQVGLEFCEVASMSMELLASPYLTTDKGGFYSSQEAARARIEFLENAICFWPYMTVVDAFQHWVYQNHKYASNPVNCDAKWSELWERYMVGVDWSDLEQEKKTGWQRKQHIHGDPFYYIEYGLAQLGALQVWRNALRDQAESVSAYRKALALGGTVSLPDLFSTAGAKFAFDSTTMQEAVDLAEETIDELETYVDC